MYAEHRFDQAIEADQVYYLDGFINYLKDNIEKTYVYNNGSDCLNCRWHTVQKKAYVPPGTASKMVSPSKEYPARVIETIASDCAPIYSYGKADRIGTYRDALKVAEYVRQHDAWPEKVGA